MRIIDPFLIKFSINMPIPCNSERDFNIRSLTMILSNMELFYSNTNFFPQELAEESVSGFELIISPWSFSLRCLPPANYELKITKWS